MRGAYQIGRHFTMLTALLYLSACQQLGDFIPPKITLLGNNPEIIEVGSTYTDAGATALDNLDGDLTTNIIAVNSTVDTTQVGNYTLMYTVSDAAGNTALPATRVVQVVDSAPTLSLLGESPLTIEAGQAYVDAGATASDLVDGDLTANITLTQNIDVNTLGSQELIYSITDSFGNNTTITRSVIVADSLAPIVDLSLLPNPITVEAGTLSLPLGPIDPLLITQFTNGKGAAASDSFAGDLTSAITAVNNVDFSQVGNGTLVFNVSDAAGNQASNALTITTVDTIAPSLTLNGNNPTPNLEAGNAYSELGATAIDLVDGDLSAQVSISGNVNTLLPADYILSYNISDATGNAATPLTRTVAVVDTTAPSIIYEDPLTLEAATAYINPVTVTDTVDTNPTLSTRIKDSLDNVVPAVDMSKPGNYSIEYVASDKYGNRTTPAALQKVIVQDTTAPVITVTGDVTLEASQTAYVDAGATASDSVDGDLSANITSTITDSAGNIIAQINTLASDLYTITYAVTDAVGNNATAVTRTVTVQDTTPPSLVITPSTNITLEAGAPLTLPTLSATDIVDGDLSANVVISGTVNNLLPGDYIITYNISDAAGNAATQQSITVTVQDNTPPNLVITPSTNITLEAGAPLTTPTLLATDIVDGDVTTNITAVITDSAGNILTQVDTSIPGIYTLTYSVSDAASNISAQSITVTVVDTTAPIITLAGTDVTLEASQTAYVDAGATATDIVNGDVTNNISTVITDSAGNILTQVNTLVPDIYTLTYSVSDAAGNIATSLTRTVTVADNIAPAITVAGTDVVLEANQTPYVDAGATATDIVDGDVTANISTVITDGAQNILTQVNTLVPDIYTLTYSVSDAAGNKSNATRTVTVKDSTSASLTLLGNNPETVVAGQNYLEAGATASDIVDGDISANITTTGSVKSLIPGEYTLSYSVTDKAGNTSNSTRTVNVVLGSLTGDSMSIAPKQLQFVWNPVIGASYYQIAQGSIGTGFSPVASGISATNHSLYIPVHKTDWSNSQYSVQACDSNDNCVDSALVHTLTTTDNLTAIANMTAANIDLNDDFGWSVSLSGDGNTMAIGAPYEDSNGNPLDNSITDSGAVYLFRRQGNIWSQTAYLKASNMDVLDQFGYALSLSDDGSVLAVGANGESSLSSGINGLQGDNSAPDSGAVYLFNRDLNGTWRQTHYLKASNSGAADQFGSAISLSADGTTLAVGAIGEASAQVNNQGDNTAPNAGAVYLFNNGLNGWQQQAYLKATNTGVLDSFGFSISLSSNGDRLAIGAPLEDSSSLGINANPLDNLALNSGAAYLFERSAGLWSQRVYLKASNSQGGASFGNAISLDDSGNVLAIGAANSDTLGLNGTLVGAGNAYLFRFDGLNWTEENLLNASNAAAGDHFGSALQLSGDGTTLIIGSPLEAGNSNGVDANPATQGINNSGAVYSFRYDAATPTSSWIENRYIKAKLSSTNANFGNAICMSRDGNTLAIGAYLEGGMGSLYLY